MKRSWEIDLLSAGGLAALVALYLAPLAAMLALSTTDFHLGAPEVRFIGAANYASLFRDHEFWRALANTAVFAALVTPATVILGFAAASALLSASRVAAFLRGLNILPFMATTAAMAVVWEVMLNPAMGVTHDLLAALGLGEQNWLRDPATALPTLAVIMVWRLFGLSMALFTAGLAGVPKHLYQAAELDGAKTGWSRLFIVTLPAISRLSAFIVLIVTIRTLEAFDLIRVLTLGGPAGATDTLLFRLYRESFDFLRIGYGSAVSVIFLLLVGGLAWLQSAAASAKAGR